MAMAPERELGRGRSAATPSQGLPAARQPRQHQRGRAQRFGAFWAACHQDRADGHHVDGHAERQRLPCWFGPSFDLFQVADFEKSPAVAVANGTADDYWLATGQGAVWSSHCKGAPDRGSMFGTSSTWPVVAITATADGQGYWPACEDGGVFRVQRALLRLDREHEARQAGRRPRGASPG